MVQFTVSYSRSTVDKLIADIIDAPKHIADYVASDIPVLLRKEIAPLATEPRLPTLPFVWSYDGAENARLRARYMKTLPRGRRGGRYVRTHQLVKNWITEGHRTRDGAEASAGNDTPYLETVQGPDNVRYPSHADSGWAQYDDVLNTAADKAVDAISDRWLLSLD